MNRPTPSYHPEQIVARVVLEPSGAHRLEVETTGGIMIVAYDANTIPQLEAACSQFRMLTTQADGGRDFHNRKTVALEIGR